MRLAPLNHLGLAIVSGGALVTASIASAATMPIAHWALDEGPGATTAVDAGGSALHGTYQSGATSGVAGIAGQAAHFDGTGEVLIGANTVINDLGNDFAISVWFKMDSAQSGATWRLFFPHDPTFANIDGGWGPGVAGSKIRFTVRGAALGDLDAGEVPVGEWNHVVGSIDSDSNLTLYLNGVEIGTKSRDGGVKAWDGDWAIGSWGGGGHFKGAIDDVQIYGGSLTADQVAFLYNNPGQAIPEPASLALLGAGALLMLRRRSA